MAACTKTAEMFSDTDKFAIHGFDHLEFFVSDAWTVTKYLKHGLGMTQIAHTNRNLHNYIYTSNVLRSGKITFVITAPYLSAPVGIEVQKNKVPNPALDPERIKSFVNQHGNGVGVIATTVKNLQAAFDTVVSNGGTVVVPITEVKADDGASLRFAEVLIYDDDLALVPEHLDGLYAGLPLYQSSTVLRLVERSDDFTGFWPGYVAYNDPKPLDYGLSLIDHVVGNVYRMDQVVSNFKRLFGLHTFAFFTPEEIRTDWTSLNSEVLASNDARFLLPINEPAPGKAESQILTYLRYYNGPGVQHIAIKTPNILKTLTDIRSNDFSIDFLDAPKKYYELPEIQERLRASNMTAEEIAMLQKLGILIDIDDNGCLLQIFTKPLFDRPTVFIEIIQRICYGDEIPGCGRFGVGNFKALFISLEPLLNPNIPEAN